MELQAGHSLPQIGELMVGHAMMAASAPVGNLVTSLPVGGETFTFSEPVQAGVGVDGVGWFVPASATTTVTRSTQPATVGGLAINGAMLNPLRHDVNFTQGLDERSGAYGAASNAGPSVAMAAGDCYWCAIGDPVTVEDPATNDQRSGFIIEHVALHALSAPRPANGVAKSSFLGGFVDGLSGTLDLSAKAAEYGALDSGEPFDLSLVQVPPVSEILAKFARLEPWGLTNANAGSGGYETITTQRRGWDGSSNYGGDLAAVENGAMHHLFGSVATIAQREELLKYFVLNGIQLYDAVANFGPIKGQGAHSQYELYSVYIALHALGRFAEIDTLETVLGSNPFEQIFEITQPFLNTLVPHDSLTGPHTYRRRAISNVFTVAGDTRTWVTVPYYRDANEGDTARINFNQLLLTRESDGATAIIETPQSKLRGDHNADPTLFDSTEGDGTQYSFAITEQPAIPFAIGDVIYAETQQPLAVGDPEWIIESDFPLTYCGSPSATYRDNNRISGMVTMAAILGYIPDTPGWRALTKYVSYANRSDFPAADYDWPDCYMVRLVGYDIDATFWAIHGGKLGLTSGSAALVSPFAINGAYFAEAASPPADTTKMRFRAKFRFLTDPGSSDAIVAQRSAGRYAVNAGLIGQYTALEDGNEVAIPESSNEFQYVIGAVYEIDIVIDFATQTLVETINGVVHSNIALTVPAAYRYFQTASNRMFMVGSFNNTAPSLPATTEFEYFDLTLTTGGVDSVVMSADTKVETIADINAKPYITGAVVAA